MKQPPRAPATRGAADGSDAANGADVAERERERDSSSGENGARLLGFLRAITDNLGEGVYAVDPAGRLTFMNPAAEGMLGWTQAELRGKDMHETIHFQRADRSPLPREQCPLLRVIGSDQVERFDDEVFTCRDGSLISVSCVSAPIVIEGALAGAVLAFHDISAHQALDEALRRSEHRAASQASQLMAIFESIADAIMVFDREGNIIQTNAADTELLGGRDLQGVALQTVQQRDAMFTVLDEQGQAIATDHWPFARVLQGEALRGANAVDITVRTRDGSAVVINASGAPVRNSEGDVVGGVLIGRDVTRRRRLERQTREALDALMAMAEAIVGDEPDIAEYTPIGGPQVTRRLANLTRAVMACRRVDIVAMEPESDEMRAVAVAGLTDEEERVWLEHWPVTGHMRDFLPSELIEQLRAGEAIQIDRTRPPFNQWGNPFNSRTMLVIPMRVGGRLLGTMVLDYGPADREVGPDEVAMAGAVAKLAAQLMERDRLARDRELANANELALAETTRRMDEFLSIAAHELKTPVTNSRLVIALASDTLTDALARVAPTRRDPHTAALVHVLEPLQTLLEQSESHMERLSRLVVDLLDISRIRAGRLELREAPCDLADVAREVVEEQRRMAPERVIRLQLPRASSRRALVLADADRIRQVVTNYLSNALRYSAAEECVTVRLRTDQEWARISVRDAGPGIPSDQQRAVWERFYRVPGAPQGSGGAMGLGLGLHICRMIVEQHHGRFGLRSAPGQGALFWFALRLMPDALP